MKIRLMAGRLHSEGSTSFYYLNTHKHRRWHKYTFTHRKTLHTSAHFWVFCSCEDSWTDHSKNKVCLARSCARAHTHSCKHDDDPSQRDTGAILQRKSGSQQKTYCDKKEGEMEWSRQRGRGMERERDGKGWSWNVNLMGREGEREGEKGWTEGELKREAKRLI